MVKITFSQVQFLMGNCIPSNGMPDINEFLFNYNYICVISKNDTMVL